MKTFKVIEVWSKKDNFVQRVNLVKERTREIGKKFKRRAVGIKKLKEKGLDEKSKEVNDLQRERERERLIYCYYVRTPKWTVAVGVCGTPPRRRSRRLLWRSPLAWNICAATGCGALRSIYMARASTGFFFCLFVFVWGGFRQIRYKADRVLLS